MLNFASYILQEQMMHTITVSPTNEKTLYPNLQAVWQIAGGAFLIAILAQVSLRLPFSPIPLTGQTFAMLLVGALLGSKRGVLSVLTYIAMGCVGLPVFAMGSFGALSLLGPSGGYFCGFILQAFLVGWTLERRSSPSSLVTLATLILACTLQLTLGCLWLGQFVGWQNVLWMGFYPFIPGEILKSVLVAAYLKSRHA